MLNRNSLMIGTAQAMMAAPSETGTNVSAMGDRASAVSMAGMLSEGTLSELASLVQAKEDGKRGPIAIMLAINADVDGDWSGFAKPDSDADTCGNRHPEKYKIEETTKDGKKNVPANWFQDYVDATPQGAAILKRLELLKQAKDGGAEAEKLPRTGANADIFEHRNEPRWLEADTRKYTQRRSTLKNLVKTATKCKDKLDLLAEHDEVVTVEYDMDGEQLARTPYPITLCSVAKRADFKVITATQLLKVNVAAAIEKGNGVLTFPNLVATLTKGAGDTVPDGQKQVLKVDGELHDAMLAIVNTLDTDDEAGAKRVAAFRTLLDPKRKASDETVKALGSLYLTLDGFWPEIEKRYNSLTRANNMDEKAA